jgi:ribose 5-phosphate isomerase B
MIAIGSDHGGFDLKKKLIGYLEQKNIEYKDFGTYSCDSCDYPDIALEVAKQVAQNKFEKGILICGTGIGMSIAANKVKGIRAALCHDVYSAKMCRRHNDANILACGARVIGEGLFLEIVDAFFNTDFEGGRHKIRIDKIARGESCL